MITYQRTTRITHTTVGLIIPRMTGKWSKRDKEKRETGGVSWMNEVSNIINSSIVLFEIWNDTFKTLFKIQLIALREKRVKRSCHTKRFIVHCCEPYGGFLSTLSFSHSLYRHLIVLSWTEIHQLKSLVFMLQRSTHVVHPERDWTQWGVKVNTSQKSNTSWSWDGCPWQSWQSILNMLLKATNLKLKDHEEQEETPSGDYECLYNINGNPSKIVEVCQSGIETNPELCYCCE